MLLTKKAALYECARLWNWLAMFDCESFNGFPTAVAFKNLWPEWENISIKYACDFDDHCPACAYFIEEKHDESESCDDNCIMNIAWPSGCLSYNGDTLYRAFISTLDTGNYQAARRYAIRIALIAEAEHAKLV